MKNESVAATPNLPRYCLRIIIFLSKVLVSKFRRKERIISKKCLTSDFSSFGFVESSPRFRVGMRGKEHDMDLKNGFHAIKSEIYWTSFYSIFSERPKVCYSQDTFRNKIAPEFNSLTSPFIAIETESAA
jgi:hypothetical protein